MNSDDNDLFSLDTLITGKTVVALGEVSHGASDIYRLKGKIIKRLVTHDSFTVFSIEANMPEAYRLNDYVINGLGDPKELIKGMLFWTWDTHEMLDIVEWMKDYNKTHNQKVLFAGFDMQSYRGSFEALSNLFDKYNTDTAFNLKELAVKLAHIDSVRRIDYEGAGMKLLKEHKHYFAKQFDALRAFCFRTVHERVDSSFFIQYVRLLEQYTLCFSTQSRDEFMAENVRWIRAQNNQAKTIIWAHNGHICRQYLLKKYHMGYYLASELKNKYLAIGFAYHKGSFTAKGKEGLKAYTAQKSFPGTYEYYFHSIGVPLFILDMRDVHEENPNAKWLLQEQLFRWTGAQPMTQEFLLSYIVGSFDLLVYLDSTRPSSLLHDYPFQK